LSTCGTREPPEIEADAEWIRLGGLISVTATDDVREAMRLAIEAFIVFNSAASEYRRSREPGFVVDPDHNPGMEMEEHLPPPLCEPRGGSSPLIRIGRSGLTDTNSDTTTFVGPEGKPHAVVPS
jgi:hypothetical protein